MLPLQSGWQTQTETSTANTSNIFIYLIMKLSIIVPIYNVERYLTRCLDSLLRQGLKEGEYEIICVNDGSTCHCGSILVDYVRRYPDIFSIYAQENHGLSDARNTGMKVARGEWIAFVDSDDYLADGGLGVLCRDYLDDFIDVLQFKFRYMNGLRPDEVKKEPALPEGEITFEGTGQDAYNKVTMVNVWTKIYRHTFLREHDIWFKTQAFEDELFNFTVFGYQPRTRAVSHNLYRYDTSDSASITRTHNLERILHQLDDLLHNLRVLNDYIESGQQGMRPGVLRRIDAILNFFYQKACYVKLTHSEWKKVMDTLRQMPVHRMNQHTSSRLGDAIAVTKNLSGRFYLAYILLYLFYKWHQ